MSFFDQWLPKKEMLEATREALRQLTDTGMFRIAQLEFHEEHYGDMWVELASDHGITVIFQRDWHSGTCKLLIENLPIRDATLPGRGRTFFLSDVLEALSLQSTPSFCEMEDKDVGFLELIRTAAAALERHWQLLVCAFDDQQVADTLSRIKRQAILSGTRNALRLLTDDATFELAEIGFNECYETDAEFIRLTSREGIEVRFVYDGNKAWCELHLPGRPEDAFLLDEVLEATGQEPIGREESRMDTIIFSKPPVIRRNWPLVAQAFDDEHRADTIKKIEAIRAAKRQEQGSA